MFFAMVSVTMLLFGAAEGFNLLADLRKELKMELAAVAHPVMSKFMEVLFSQCAVVKNVFGIKYRQMKEVDEPDVSALTLEFRGRKKHLIFKILTAATDIPKSRIYHPNNTFIIYVHGFTSDPTTEEFREINKVFEKIGYFALNGSSLIRWLYLRSTIYARFMGEKLAEVLAAISKGHVDFFPNGGSKQPGCVIPGCDHSRSWYYYVASVAHPDAFPAVKCRDWEAFKKGHCQHKVSNMGYGCARSVRGSYYLQTGDSHPYGLGLSGTTFNYDEAFVDIFFSAARSLLQHSG